MLFVKIHAVRDKNVLRGSPFDVFMLSCKRCYIRRNLGNFLPGRKDTKAITGSDPVLTIKVGQPYMPTAVPDRRGSLRVVPNLGCGRGI